MIDPATLGSVLDPATSAAVRDPATSATVIDPVALARATDTAANEDSNEPPATSGIVSDRAAPGFMTSTGADPVGHDRSEIPTENEPGRVAADTQLRRERDLTATTNLGTVIQSEIGRPLER